jgi:hypothetical protein
LSAEARNNDVVIEAIALHKLHHSNPPSPPSVASRTDFSKGGKVFSSL